MSGSEIKDDDTHEVRCLKNILNGIDDVLFDPTICMRSKLATLVAMRLEGRDGESSGSNIFYAAAVGSTDPRAGSRARSAAVKDGLLSAIPQSGRETRIKVNYDYIHAMRQAEAECAEEVFKKTVHEALRKIPMRSERELRAELGRILDAFDVETERDA